MTRTRHVFALVLILVLLAGMGACATSGVGKAVQAADVQKKLVEAAAEEFAKAHLCTGQTPLPPQCQGRPALTDETYKQGKAAYQKWYASHVALSSAIVTAKAVTTSENEQKVQTALQRVMADVNKYLELVGAFVNVPELKKKVGA